MKTILIVEDNESNMKLYLALLEKRGHHTICAYSGMAAMALARAHQPDLVLMDMQLGDVSGLEVTGWIKQDPSLAHIPVIAVTAFVMKGDDERFLAGGCDAYIPKPISIPEFLGVIEHMLDDKTSAA